VIRRGEALGLVGESGCGKSTVAYGLAGYLGKNGKYVGGEVSFQGQALTGRSERELRRLRGNQIAMVFQDPMTSLNPVLRIEDQLTEVLTAHRDTSRAEARERCVDMLRRVYMPDPARVMERYPHQISGGQQQRAVIAMAMLNDPALLIMDEPTTSLDVTVEAAVLDLVADLRREFDTAILFITHNLGVIAQVSDRVGVMYAGELVEMATVRRIFDAPRHPYTQGLIRCLPRLGRTKTGSVLYPIRGRVPPPDELPSGCVFQPRCYYARRECLEQRPPLRSLGDGHFSACLFSEEIEKEEWTPPHELTSPVVESAPEEEQDAILSIDDLRVYYPHGGSGLVKRIGLAEQQFVKAVDGVSLDVPRGLTLGIVGESGCGKSTLAKAIIGLEAPEDGKMEFLGFDVCERVQERDLELVRELQMVFQSPDSTLNPRYSVGRQIGRCLRRFKVIPDEQVRTEVVRLLRAVKLDAHYYGRLPRQLSGGEKQRVGIARAFAGRPDLVLCDEPVSALDVSVQAAVLNLLLEIQREYNTSLIFIAHDLSVVRFFSDLIAVMYLGEIVEMGPAQAIYEPPYHPYTESLLAAVPVPDPNLEQKHIRLEGAVPSALHPPSGCHFHPRCPRRDLAPEGGKICEVEEPPFQQAGGGHRILCHIPVERLRAFDPVVHTEEEGESQCW
jgi:peptide/nickel transport system ATP-binding protein